MERPNIRFAEKSDLNALVYLCELHAIYEKTVYDPTDKIEKLSKHLFSNSPSMYCIVVEVTNELIGYATYMKQFSTWDAEIYLYLDCLFLIEKARGYGIGEQLMNIIKQEALKMQFSHIQWQTPDFNIKAIKFYRRIGAQSKTKERFILNI
ncbi:MAG: GNAT family N-acetyltransferase [Maribacter litoralis]|uniref:GNAT family N-acetyltransferase n=1 Tax=Maribacter litoralis TaxID=2059726 RepID=UPI003296946F